MKRTQYFWKEFEQSYQALWIDCAGSKPKAHLCIVKGGIELPEGSLKAGEIAAGVEHVVEYHQDGRCGQAGGAVSQVAAICIAST